MDSPLVNRIFRRLFAHETCSRYRIYRPRNINGSQASLTQARYFLWDAQEREQQKRYGGNEKARKDNFWRARNDLLLTDHIDDYKRFPLVTADHLRPRKERPKRVKMTVRDFIEDSLYNPNYGYFSKQAVIFSPGEPFDFQNMKDEPEFYKILGNRYSEFEDELDAQEVNETRQLWHTPTELFRPYYGETMARYMVANYQLLLYPYYDLIIYEMGAGNGTMMLNILDYIRANHPDVYQRTQYKIIEISSSLATLQNKHLRESATSQGHIDKVEIINRSIFDWDTYVSSPCFFLALEVFDNFAHDAIRYDPKTAEALQGHVLIDGNGDFYEIYEREIDAVALRYLKVRDLAATMPFQTPLRRPGLIRRLLNQKTYTQPQLYRRVRRQGNLTIPEYIPTRLMQFFDILHNYFPAHRLLASDFHTLPDAVVGINGPVVQTRYQRRMIPVSTPLVQQGYFDILFPTDFKVMEDMYRAITGKFTQVMSHEAFMNRWAYVEDTQTKSGENPLLSWYKNASFMITV
ncbi:uncharacterized protein PV09_08838 [Verruconis gallopava]|uniref:Protein arginine methyltransferase NDUFAF7 n=1 Tax=Verruconis gallopava TaxID=253628 RepID=A0A0D1ZYQ0_9PEZI|nr:uncharacterized protein PV09_08838 [Verruconis gallopava]KIV99537.1 hypothetical protein PV09_08838 [Verruconis gallopava]